MYKEQCFNPFLICQPVQIFHEKIKIILIQIRLSLFSIIFFFQMIVHTPVSVQQRGNFCAICQNKSCVFSFFIEPCQCQGPAGVVHEQCLTQTVNATYFDHSSLSCNQEGFLTYVCPRCQGPIMFREGFRRQFIKCGEYDGCEKFVIGIYVFSLLIILFGLFLPLMVDLGNIEFGIYVILTIALFIVLYTMYKRLTTQFWKLKPSNESQMNFNNRS